MKCQLLFFDRCCAGRGSKDLKLFPIHLKANLLTHKRYTLMKKIVALMIFFGIQTCFGQKQIPYYLPSKYFHVTVIYTVKDTKVFKKADKTLKDSSLLRHYTTVSIEDPIRIEGKLVLGGEPYYFDFSDLGSAGKSFNMTIGFDSSGNGTLATFNGEQQPVTADIIEGTVSVIGSVIGIVAKNIIPFKGFKGSNDDGEIVVTEEQKVEIQEIITSTSGTTEILLNQANPSGKNRVKFNDNGFVQFYNLVTDIPKVTITFASVGSTTQNSSQQSNTNAGTTKDKIYYRVPQPTILTVKLSNNMFAGEYVAVEQLVYIPQTGALAHVPVELVRGKRTLEITFDQTTGNLTKYSLKKESNLKATLTQTKSSVDALSTAVKDLQDRINEKNSLQTQIDQLKLENEKIELQKKQKDLLESDPAETQ